MAAAQDADYSGWHAACVVSLVVALALAWPYPLAAQRAERGSLMDNALIITIGDKAFGATLSDNPTAAAFKALLPMSIDMSELNGNEKLFRLPGSLPAQPSRPPSIRSGDLMLYGSSTVVLFYKSFATTYSYTRIGRIDDPAGLERAVGDGRVTVTFAVRQTK